MDGQTEQSTVISLDPTRISVRAVGRTEPETLDAYIRRLIREECQRSTATIRAVGRCA